eukprot:527550_1
MSQTKNTDNSNSDEIPRSIIQSMVDQAAGDSKGGGTTHSKPPLPHNNDTRSPTKVDQKSSKKAIKNDNNLKDDQYQKSSSNRNIVFHPDHPEKIYDLSSTSTADSRSRSPNTSSVNAANDPNASLIPKKSSHQTTDNVMASPKSNPANPNHTHPKHRHQPTNASASLNGPLSNPSPTNPAKQSSTSTTNDGPKHKSKSSTNNDGKSSSKPLDKRQGPSASLSREQRRERRRKLEDPNCFPKRFEVQVQARVRVGQDLSSQHLTDLPEGSVVTVEEIIDRRARISRPLCGWLSVTSKFGARIILPTNSKYSKIGGKVMFKRPIYNQQVTAKVVDYIEETQMYKVSFGDGQTQMVDFEDTNVQFISQHKAVKVQKPLDGAAPTFTLQTSQAFFNQFFCKDYPQYQAQSSSTTRHMDISPVAMHGVQSRFRVYPSHGMPPTHNGQPPPGHGPPPHAGYPPPPDQHRNRMYGPPPPRGHGPPAGYPPQRHPRDPRDPRSAQPQPPYVPTERSSKQPIATSKNGSNDAKSKTNAEFVNKVKEIERRIIQHLHQRGYDESHPDYHRYLQKAKELAIQKAGKEREKMLAQQRKRQVDIAAQRTGVSKAEYEQYMRYKQEKQRQHAVAEQQRKERIEAQQRAQQQQQAAAHNTSSGSASGKLTSPSKSSGSVKGLIVLRGLPGSGKTTLAKKLAQRSKNARICTEDRYHWSGKEDGVGEYKFQPQLVFLAREWCTKEIRECIQSNVNLIILDNHNARISMYEDHIQYAVEHGYRFRIIEFVATASLIDKYRARSYKKFPREVYVKLLKLWEHDPRTELINPTFGDALKDSAKKEKKEKGDANDPAKEKKESNEKESDHNPSVERENMAYSRRPLDQGLNLNNKMPNDNNQ